MRQAVTTVTLTDTSCCEGVESHLSVDRRYLEIDFSFILLPEDVHLGCCGFKFVPSPIAPCYLIERNFIFLQHTDSVKSKATQSAKSVPCCRISRGTVNVLSISQLGHESTSRHESDSYPREVVPSSCGTKVDSNSYHSPRSVEPLIGKIDIGDSKIGNILVEQDALRV